MAASLGAAVPTAFAQSSPLAQAVEATWSRTVASAQAQGQLRRAEAELGVAHLWWAAPPVLELGHRDDRLQSNRGGRETEVSIALPLWRSGERGARLNAAQADKEAALASVAAGRHRVAGTVREAAWAVATQRVELEAAEARQLALRTLSTDVERRVAAGDLARTDALAARAELLGASNAVAMARQQLQAALQTWTALTGLATVPQVLDEADTQGPQEHPSLRAARLQVEAARRRADAVNASRVASPELIARMRQDVSGRSEPTNNSFGLAVRIPLGTAERNTPLLAAALAEVDVAESSERLQAEQQQADVAIARAAQASAAQQWKDEGERAALLAERVSLVDKAFAAGEISLPETLRTLASAQDARAAAKRQEAALGLARARLLQALGITP